MRGAYSLGWRYLKERRGRSVLTGAGIALGVAIVFGVLVANESTARTFDRLIESVNGRADVLVTPIGAADAVLPEDSAARLGALDGVELAAPIFAVELAEARGRADPGDSLFWLEGVDPQLDRELRSWDIVAGTFPRPGRAEVALGRAQARAAGLEIGDRRTVRTPTGPRDLTVSGVLTETGLGGRAGHGSLTVRGRVLTTIEAARDVAGAGEGFTAVAVLLEEGVDPEGWVEDHREALAGTDVRTTVSTQREFQSLLGLFLGSLTWVASISLFIGGFLIYLTLSRAVAERTQTHGIMRAVGASRGQVRTAVLSEATVLGLVATAVGIALGLAIAAGVTRLLQALGFPPVGLIVPSGAIVVASIVGVGTTLVSALLPARRAARVRPAEAIRGRLGAALGSSRTWMVGALLVSAGVAATFVGTEPGAVEDVLIYGVTVAVLLGCVLLVPPVLRPLAWLLGRLTARLARGTGDVSVRHLVRERSRSAYTLALIMVVLAGLFTFGAIDAAMVRASDEVFEAQYGRPDLLVRAERGILPGFAHQRVRDRPEVHQSTAVRFASTRLVEPQRPVFALVVDPRSYFDVAGFAWVAGDERSARRDLRSRGVLLSEGVARSNGIRRGDRVRFETNRGPQEFMVVGTIQSLFHVDAVFDADTARTFLNAGNPSAILVEVRPNADPRRLARALERELEPYGASVLTTSNLQGELDEFGIRGLVRVFLAILLVAAIIGLLGLANTLTMSVTERVREIGVMRATGATRGQVRRMVIAESATLGLTAFVLALPLGWLLTTLVVRGASVEGLTLKLTYPALWVPILAGMGIVIAVAAAVGPAWRAGRLRPATALRFE